MAKSSVTERSLIEWFLKRVNGRGERDAARKNLDTIIASRTESGPFRAFAANLAPSLTTATGALEIRVGLARNARGKMAMNYILDGWNFETAASGTEAFALSLLLDETRSHQDHLGRCAICGIYFLAPEQDGAGAKATTYCGDKCVDQGKREKMLERVRQHRAREASKARRKP